MSFTYNPPTGLAGTVSGLNATLTWNVPTIINSPSLLLHMDGANGSTAFVDSSSNALALTATGTVHQSTAGSKFGSACGSFSGGGSLTTPITGGGPLDLVAGDYTIEGWFNLGVQVGGQSIIIEIKDAGASSVSVFFQSASNNIAGTIDNQAIAGAANSFSQGVYHHLAIAMASNSFTVYIDGIATATPQLVTRQTLTAASFILSDPVLPVTGLIDEFRVTKGTALYTANFTPPALPFSTPPGYDVYRNGVSVGTFLGGPSFIDTVPVGGIYTYNVAAWDGAADISALSAPLVLNVSAPVVPRYGKFAGSRVFPPTLIVDAGNIKPRVWMPKENITVKA